MSSLRWELSTCSKWWTSPTSPNLDIGPWILNCWMSSLTGLVPCCRLESFCHTTTSQFGSMNMRLTSASNSSIIISISEGLRTCWILCVTHLLVAPPFMYDRMNNIQLVSSGNSDPHRCMYKLHSALKWSRSSCRPVNGMGAAIFGSLVMAGGGGGPQVVVLSRCSAGFCSTWIWSVSWATCSLGDDMVMGSKEVGVRKVGEFEVFFCSQSAS